MLHLRLIALPLLVTVAFSTIARAAPRPNILLCISDDQSYAHAGANGDPIVQTPAFDRIAREGLRFTRAFCDAPSCGPSRSALLTGQPIWRLAEAGNIHSTLPARFKTYTETLEQAGYTVGFTGKGWSPGRLQAGGRDRNPAGREFASRKLQPTQRAMSNRDYAANFADFLEARPEGKPFCFWLGTYEPHRAYHLGAGTESGKDPSKVKVPGYLPDVDIVRRDILDYYTEVEHFDQMVNRALKLLEASGELDNTIVVITSDHGMPFPRAKASLYDSGTHVPLAIRWPPGIKSPGRAVDTPVNLSDLAPTFLDAADVDIPPMMIAHSMQSIFRDAGDSGREQAFSAMERHDGCRAGGKGYPCRSIRTADYLYIYNFEPTRWPSGSPDASVCARAIPYGEIDSSPTKTFLMENRDKHGVAKFSQWAFGMRPAEELYAVQGDPDQLVNLAGKPQFTAVQQSLRTRLFDHLKETGDPRVAGGAVDWDFYPYYGLRRNKNWQVDPRPTGDD